MSSLTLSRKRYQSIVLFTEAGEQVVITVGAISKNAVKLNFEAPANVEIWRDEMLEKVDGD